MKKIIILISIFSLFFIFLTFLNHELEILDRKLNTIQLENRKLEDDLNFLKTEWEYVNNPENIALLSKKHFNHNTAELINFNTFIKTILRPKENEK